MAGVEGVGAVAPKSGISKSSQQAILAADMIRVSIDEMASQLERRNNQAALLRQMKDQAMALDGLRSNGAVTLVKLDADGNKVVDTNKVQSLLEFIELNNALHADEPSNQINANTLWDDPEDAGDASKINVSKLETFDIKVNGISLFSKETAAAALSSLGTQITDKVSLIDKELIQYQKLGNQYKNLTELAATLIALLTKIFDTIFQRM